MGVATQDAGSLIFQEFSMRVFLTGATGFIGSAIVQELLSAGHEVLGLARSDAAAEALARLGVRAHRGELADPASLATAAKACDGVIHTAFIHDFAAHAAAAETDRQAVTAMLGALEGTGKPLVATSVTVLLAHTHPATEDTPVPEASPNPRAKAEAMVLAAAGRGVRASVVRLPPSVHGTGDYGFVPRLVNVARSKGVSAFIGEGANRWPAVHRLDAARLYRLALESALPGARLHAVAEEGITLRAIAEAIGAGLGLPARGIAADEAPAHFDWLARFLPIDNPTSSALTRNSLGWQPQEAELLVDMRESGYFA
jgi:nucleoside-diphosphate-sugar epimerase